MKTKKSTKSRAEKRLEIIKILVAWARRLKFNVKNPRNAYRYELTINGKAISVLEPEVDAIRKTGTVASQLLDRIMGTEAAALVGLVPGYIIFGDQPNVADKRRKAFTDFVAREHNRLLSALLATAMMESLGMVKRKGRWVFNAGVKK